MLKLFKYIKKHFRSIYSLYFRVLIIFAPNRFSLILKRIKYKRVINVAFQVVHSSVWKYDSLYWLLKADSSFNPFIVICPYNSSSTEEQKDEYIKSVELCKKYGYSFFDTKVGNTFVDIKNTGCPEVDMVFLQNAWELTLEKYKIKAWRNTLPCYSSYFFNSNILHKENYGKSFHKLLFRYFLETDWHLNLAKRYTNCNFDKLVVTGYPGLDSFRVVKSTNNPWQDITKSGKRKKRIIYAPHHTIGSSDAGLGYSTFDFFGLDILDVVNAFSDDCHFAFKPHPLLFGKLAKDPGWGLAKAKKYYQFWQDKSNTQLEEGDYDDLFNHSDGLIHDCNSFLAEYLITLKPPLFLGNVKIKDIKVNDFGKKLIKAHYYGCSKNDINIFIQDVILRGNDTKISERESFVKENLIKNKDKLASSHIYEEIKKCVM